MTDPTESVELDPRVADLLGVPVPVSREALARGAACSAGFAEPTTPLLIEFWVALATCIDEQLAREATDTMAGRDAAHHVRSCVVHNLGPDGEDRVLDELRPRHLDCALAPWLMRDIVRGMAARGAYRLVGAYGPGIYPNWD